MVKRVILRILCWPLYFGTLLALIIRALWGKEMRWVDGTLVVRLSETSWPEKSWYKNWGGTTFGYGIMLASSSGAEILEHELVHVEQLEANTLSGIYLGALASIVSLSPWPMLVGWLSGGALAYLGAMLTAWLRSEASAYRGNHLEEAAYNATEVKCLRNLSDR